MRLSFLLAGLFFSLTAACGGTVDGGGGGAGGTVDGGGGGAGASMCTEPAASLDFELSVDASAWPVEEGTELGVPDVQDITTDCAVESATVGDGAAEVSLLCDDGSEQQPFGVSLSGLPGEFEVPLAAGSQVRLDYHWRSDGHHISTGQWLVIHDAPRERLLLSAVDYDRVSATSERIAPFSIATDEAICEPPCGNDSVDCDEPHRLGLVFDGADGAQVTVLDGSRGELRTGGDTYDLVVATARRWFCLNCPSWYDVVIAGEL